MTSLIVSALAAPLVSALKEIFLRHADVRACERLWPTPRGWR